MFSHLGNFLFSQHKLSININSMIKIFIPEFYLYKSREWKFSAEKKIFIK